MPFDDGWEPISPDDGWEPITPDQFPGMPSPSMRNQAQPWQMPQVGNVDELAQFQKSQEPPEPPAMLARPKEAIGLEERNRGLDDPQSPEFLALRDRAQMQGTAEAAGPSMAILASGAGAGMLPQLTNRGFGAYEGYRVGSKGAKMAGLPGLAGGIPGAIVGAVAPGATTAAGIGEQVASAIPGGDALGIPGAVAGLVLRKRFGPVIDAFLRMRGGAAVGEAAAVTGSERIAAKVAAAKAEEAARKAATEALGVGKAAPKVLTEAEKAAAAARPWEAPKPNWGGMGDEAAAEAAAIAPTAPTPPTPSAASYADELKAANEARAARLAAADKEAAVKRAMEPVTAEPMPAAEERLYTAAEAAETRRVIKAEQDYLKATEAAAKKAATQRAVGDGVKRSSVPKTDNVIEGDFIDPSAVSIVPETAPVLPTGQRAMATNLGGSARPGPAPTAPQDLEAALRQTLEEARLTKALPKAGTAPSVEMVPSNYESTAAQTRSVEALRKEIGADKAARKLGIPKDQVNQIRLDAGDRGTEALGQAAGLPEGARRAIVSKLKGLKSREEVMAYIRKANNEKARLQIEGIAVGMGLL